eukprot:COSAG02_NODE_50236_length_322_cov_0.390135_1_plen_90_part_10
MDAPPEGVAEKPGASGGAEAEAAARLAQLKEELYGLKMVPLQQKAAEAGIADEKIAYADDKADLIELILVATAAKESDVAPSMLRDMKRQ